MCQLFSLCLIKSNLTFLLLSVFVFMKASLDCRLSQWYVYVLETVLDFVRCCGGGFLNHGNNSIIMNFCCLLWSIRSFGVAEQINAFLLIKNSPDFWFAYSCFFLVSLSYFLFWFDLICKTTIKPLEFKLELYVSITPWSFDLNYKIDVFTQQIIDTTVSSHQCTLTLMNFNAFDCNESVLLFAEGCST